MSRSKRCKVDTRQANVSAELVGREYLPLIQEHLVRLRAVRSHPNRLLHMDQLLTVMLLAMSHGTDRSLRMIDDLSAADAVQNLVGLPRTCRSTLSNALAVLDVQHILPVIKDLRARLPDLPHEDADLATLLKKIVALDGSIFTVPADVLWAIAAHRSNQEPGRQVRLNLHLDVLQFMPVDWSLSGSEEGSETKAFAARLEPDRIYLCDRNFGDFTFIRKVLDLHSDLVVRIKNNIRVCAVQDQPTTDADKQAGVLRDTIVTVPGCRASPGFGDQRFREVIVWDERNKKEVRLLTTLLGVPAATIGQLYRYRWTIELFFRWLKCVAKVRHLVAHNQNGIRIQFCVAIILVLLTYLRTGQRPGVYEFNCLSWVASGLMSVQTMQEVLARRQRERDLAKARRLRKQQVARTPA